jgi:uncharacterized protein involved in exopolysaccharide biosynthesis
VRSWIRLVARLYPKGWRERYGAGFDALLEEASLSGTDMLDILRGALEMHMKTWGFRKLAVVCGLAGAILAAGVAFWMPDEYVSTAVIGVRSADGKTVLTEQLKQHVLSRGSLVDLIRKDDLYAADRLHMPLEDVVARMRHDIRVVGIESAAGRPRKSAVTVQYVYGDPGQAQRTTRELVARLMEANVTDHRPDTVGLTLEVLDPASLPRTRMFPNRLTITVLGIGAGLLLASLAAVAMRLRRQAA